MIRKDMLSIEGAICRLKDGKEFTFEEIEDIFEDFRNWLKIRNLIFFGEFHYLDDPTVIVTTSSTSFDFED